MPPNARVSIVSTGVSEKKQSIVQNENRQSNTQSIKVSNFETAIAAAGYGKFHVLLFLVIIPVSWAPSFDTTNTGLIAPSAGCDLDLSLFHKGILNAATYIGMVSSGFLWGFLADTKGRKKILFWGYLADAVCNILSGFSQDFWTLLCFKFLCGFIVSGPYASTMAYAAEFYSEKDRARILLAVGFVCSFGCIVAAGLAWMIIPQSWSIVLFNGAFVYNSWRIYLSACGLPGLIGVACLSFFPESPKFLASQGRPDEALKVLKKIYAMNTGKPAETFPIAALENEKPVSTELPISEKDTKKTKKSGGFEQIKPIFKYPLVTRLILIVTIQFCGMLAMNTLRLWQPQLFTFMREFDKGRDVDSQESITFCEIMDFATKINPNDTIATPVNTTCKAVTDSQVYIQSTMVTSTTNVSMLLAILFVNLLGHKYLLLISYAASLTSLLALNWSASTTLSVALTCMFIGLMSTTLNVVIGVAVNLFPTSLRAMAVSITMVVGRLGTIIGNLLFPVLLAYGCLAPIIGLSSFLVVCLILTTFIPKPGEVKK